MLSAPTARVKRMAALPLQAHPDDTEPWHVQS